VIDKLADIIAHHPDRGPFEVAQNRATGRDRARLLFLEFARWPDDARGTTYDHPTWHYASRPVIRAGTPNPPRPTDASGQAIEALELNLRVAANPHAPIADRAVALCWVMHITGDMHQPLHSASLYSAAYPHGDSGGNDQYVIDPATHQPVTLHWFWDDSVLQDGDSQGVIARAQAIEQHYPRASLTQLRAIAARNFAEWAFRETFPFSAQAFPPNFVGGANAQCAVALPPGYADTVHAITERRIAIAGYRLADLLREIAAEREGHTP
jgi:hypothetical protein